MLYKQAFWWDNQVHANNIATLLFLSWNFGSVKGWRPNLFMFFWKHNAQTVQEMAVNTFCKINELCQYFVMVILMRFLYFNNISTEAVIKRKKTVEILNMHISLCKCTLKRFLRVFYKANWIDFFLSHSPLASEQWFLPEY